MWQASSYSKLGSLISIRISLFSLFGFFAGEKQFYEMPCIVNFSSSFTRKLFGFAVMRHYLFITNSNCHSGADSMSWAGLVEGLALSAEVTVQPGIS